MTNNSLLEQALLAEYQACQQDKNSLATVHWTVASIFLGFNSAILIWGLYKITSPNVDFEHIKYIVLIFSIGMIIILVLLLLWLNRVNHLINVNNRIMKRIESNLRMVKKDKSAPCPFRHWWQYMFFFLFFLWWVPPKGACIVKSIYLILILSWVFLIVLVWCPIVRISIIGG
jgi:hypothetical protein